jgi:hypothetical protein
MVSPQQFLSDHMICDFCRSSHRTNELAGQRSHDMCFLCGLRYTTAELCFLWGPCQRIIKSSRTPEESVQESSADSSDEENSVEELCVWGKQPNCYVRGIVTSCSSPASAHPRPRRLPPPCFPFRLSAGCLSCLADLVPDSGAVKTEFRPPNFLWFVLG